MFFGMIVWLVKMGVHSKRGKPTLVFFSTGTGFGFFFARICGESVLGDDGMPCEMNGKPPVNDIAS